MSKTSIAVIGLTGNLGKPVLDAAISPAFADKIQFPIKAISRSEHASTSQVEYIKADLSETDKLAKELAGIDVIIELTAPTPDIFASIESLVAQVKPKLFIPSQFGVDISQVSTYAPGFLGQKQTHSANIRKSGVKVVDISTSLFAVPGTFLYEWVAHVGIDAAASTVEIRGDINQPISYSTLVDIGKVVIAVATYPHPEKLPDSFRFESGKITVKEIIDSYEKKHNVKLTVSKQITKEEALKEFEEDWAKGFDPTKFFSYLHYIVSQGADKGINFTSVLNELVNPNEAVWKYSKYEL